MLVHRAVAALTLLALCHCEARGGAVRSRARDVRAVVFETQRVSVGGRSAPAAAVIAQGERSSQQNWFFADRPEGAGPLRVRVSVRGARYIGSDDEGLVFDAGLARVRYSHGLWVDRDGRRERVLAAFREDAIELEVSEAVLARTSFPAVLDPTVTLLNGSGVIEPAVAVDQAYPAMLDERGGFIGVGHFRSVMSAPEAHGVAVDLVAATTSPMPVTSSPGHDLIGLTAIDAPLRGFVGAYRQTVGASTNLYVASYPPATVIGSTGFAPMDLPEMECARDGRCAATYTRVDAPAGVVVRRFDVVPSGMTAGLGMGGVTWITDPPLLGQHDIAMFGERPVVASAHRNMATLVNVVRVARLSATQYSGTFSDRLIELDGERPRVACGPADCAVVFVRGNNLFAARFAGGALPATDTVEALTLNSFVDGVGAFDVTAIAGGYRVAHVRTSMMGARSVMVIADYVGSFAIATATRTEHPLLNGAEFVRLSTTPGSSVSLLAWVNGTGPMATSMGAVVRPDPVVADAGPEASVDASDASDEPDVSLDVASLDDVVAMPDASAPMDAASAMDAAALDVASAPDASAPRDPAVRFSGGACECRAGVAAGARSSRAWWLLVALAWSSRRRVQRAVSARS